MDRRAPVSRIRQGRRRTATRERAQTYSSSQFRTARICYQSSARARFGPPGLMVLSARPTATEKVLVLREVSLPMRVEFSPDGYATFEVMKGPA